MGCGCKSNTGNRRQVSQVTKKNPSTVPSHTVTRSSVNNTRKQIIIRRPTR